MTASPSPTLLTLGNDRYTLDARAGRLVSTTNSLHSIRLQDLEAHLLDIVRRGDRAATNQCLDVAATVDRLLLRPAGSTTSALHAVINAAPRPGANLSRVPTAAEQRQKREAAQAEIRESRRQLRELVFGREKCR